MAKLSLEEIKEIAFKGINPENKLEDIAKDYGINVSYISLLIKDAIANGVVTQEQFSHAKSQRFSKSKKGKKNPFYGKHHSYKLRTEDRQALLDLVKEEIIRYQLGQIKGISTKKELARLAGCSWVTIGKILKQDRRLQYQREKILHSITAKRTNEIYGSPFTRLTYEQRSKYGKMGYPKGLAIANLTMTHEERVENGKKAFLASQNAPNGVEKNLMNALKDLYAEDKDNAIEGQIYYPGTNGNKWFVKFEDGKYKLPDFKVKGQKKVIEIYGEYHHSKEFCEKHGICGDYNYIPERLMEEYSKKGIECKVYWSKEMKNTRRLNEIVHEIKYWINKDAKSSQPNYMGAA